MADLISCVKRLLDKPESSILSAVSLVLIADAIEPFPFSWESFFTSNFSLPAACLSLSVVPISRSTRRELKLIDTTINVGRVNKMNQASIRENNIT